MKPSIVSGGFTIIQQVTKYNNNNNDDENKNSTHEKMKKQSEAREPAQDLKPKAPEKQGRTNGKERGGPMGRRREAGGPMGRRWEEEMLG